MTGQAARNIELIRSYTEQGLTRNEIAGQLNLGVVYVSALAKQSGIALNGINRAGVTDAAVISLASEGMTAKEIAQALGKTHNYVNHIAQRLQIKLPRGVHPRKRRGPNVRDQQMAALYRSGQTLEQIGKQFDLTRERVRQLLTKYCNVTALEGGQSVISARKRSKFEARRNALSLKKWGCGWQDYVAIRELKKPTRAYASQRKNAHKRGIGWELNLWQWWSIWQQSGHWQERGRGQGYVMSRIGDVGPYAVDNVFIATARENSTYTKNKKSDLPPGVRKNPKCAGYTAFRMINGVKLRLGSFPTPELAHAAYLSASLPSSKVAA